MNIKTKLDAVLTACDLMNDEIQVSSITTDSASNMLLATAMMGTEVKGFPCVAHKIHSAVTAAITKTTEYNELLANCKKIYTFFKHNSMARLDLERERNEEGKKSCHVVQSIPTRWNSDLGLIRQFLEFSNSIASALTSSLSSKRPDFLTASQLNVIRETEALLASLEDFTKTVCKDREPTISSVIPQTTLALKFLGKAQLNYDLSAKLRDALIAQVHKYVTSLEQNVEFGIATLLDPRLKKEKNVFQNKANSRKAELHLRSLLEEMMVDDGLKKPKGVLFDFMASEISSGPNPRQGRAKDILDTYLDEKKINLEDNPISYWILQKGRWPELSK